MVITKEKVEERLEFLKKELQQLLTLHKVYEGAVQDCQYWLAELAKADLQKVQTTGELDE